MVFSLVNSILFKKKNNNNIGDLQDHLHRLNDNDRFSLYCLFTQILFGESVLLDFSFHPPLAHHHHLPHQHLIPDSDLPSISINLCWSFPLSVWLLGWLLFLLSPQPIKTIPAFAPAAFICLHKSQTLCNQPVAIHAIMHSLYPQIAILVLWLRARRGSSITQVA